MKYEIRPAPWYLSPNKPGWLCLHVPSGRYVTFHLEWEGAFAAVERWNRIFYT